MSIGNKKAKTFSLQKLGVGNGIRYCSECEDDYSRTRLDWDSLAQGQVLHRSRMQAKKHILHELYKKGYKSLCSAAPCFGVFRNDQDRDKHEQQRICLRMAYLAKTYPFEYKLSKYSRDIFAFGAPKFTERPAKEFLTDISNISLRVFGLSFEQCLSRYQSFSALTCAEEVRRRLRTKGKNDLSIFRVPGIDNNLNKPFSTQQLAIHDNIGEHLQLLEKYKALGPETEENSIPERNAILHRIEELQQQRDITLRNWEEAFQNYKRKWEQDYLKQKMKKVARRELLDEQYERSHAILSSYYEEQGKEIEPIVSYIDPSLIVDKERFSGEPKKKTQKKEKNQSEDSFPKRSGGGVLDMLS